MCARVRVSVCMYTVYIWMCQKCIHIRIASLCLLFFSLCVHITRGALTVWWRKCCCSVQRKHKETSISNQNDDDDESKKTTTREYIDCVYQVTISNARTEVKNDKNLLSFLFDKNFNNWSKNKDMLLYIWIRQSVFSVVNSFFVWLH